VNAAKSIYQKFKLTGSFSDISRSSRSSLDEDKTSEVKEIFADILTTSSRNAALQLNVNYMTVYNILKNNEKIFPYKLKLTQELHEEDLASRAAMSEALIN